MAVLAAVVVPVPPIVIAGLPLVVVAAMLVAAVVRQGLRAPRQPRMPVGATMGVGMHVSPVPVRLGAGVRGVHMTRKLANRSAVAAASGSLCWQRLMMVLALTGAAERTAMISFAVALVIVALVVLAVWRLWQGPFRSGPGDE